MKLLNTAFKNNIYEYCETYPHHMAEAGEDDAKFLSDMENHFEVNISELLDEINIYIEQTR